MHPDFRPKAWQPSAQGKGQRPAALGGDTKWNAARRAASRAAQSHTYRSSHSTS